MREHYLLNPTLQSVEEADALILIGTNPRIEAAVWNARIRKAWLWNDLKVYVIGEAVDLTYDYEHLGTGPEAISRLGALSGFEKPMVVVGENALIGEAGSGVLAASHAAARTIGAIQENWAGFGVLHRAAGRVGALDIGFVPGEGGLASAQILSGGLQTVVLLGADEVDLRGLSEATVVYIGSHGDAGASAADIVLPAAAYTEMVATYVNTEGRVQMTRRAVQPKGEAREGWAIFRALSEVMGLTLPYDTADALREKIRESHPVLAGHGFAPGHGGAENLSAALEPSAALSTATFGAAIDDFYLTNPIARASATMAECSLQKQGLATQVAAE